jgi:hypothetical protein
MERAWNEMESSGVPASSVAACIVDALEAPRPLTRYLVGKTAPLEHVARRLLPDWIFDRILMWKLKL